MVEALKTRTIGAQIAGCDIKVGQPLGLMVRGLRGQFAEPFQAVTKMVIKGVTPAGDAVILEGGAVIPTTHLEERNRIVSVCLYPDNSGRMPTVNLSSLQRGNKFPTVEEAGRFR